MLSIATLSLLQRPLSKFIPLRSYELISCAVSKRVPISSMSSSATSSATAEASLPESVLSGEDKSLNRLTRTPSMYKLGKHRSNALELVNKVPIIEVSGDMAICDGGGGALGHPVEYIKVGSRGGAAVSCIYCGLKYRQKDGGHDHH